MARSTLSLLLTCLLLALFVPACIIIMDVLMSGVPVGGFILAIPALYWFFHERHQN